MWLTGRLAWKLAFGLGGLVLLSVSLYCCAMRSLDNAFTQADFTPLFSKVKVAASDFVVLRQPPKPNQNTAASEPDAKLVDLWYQSGTISLATLQAKVPGEWVHSTEDEPYLQAADRLDPWKHSLCVLRRGVTVAVISGGPNAPRSPACRDVSMSEEELSKLPQARLIETPGGNFIFVASQQKN